MKLPKFFSSKKDLDSLSVEELKMSKIKLEKKIEIIQSEIADIEERIDAIKRKAKTIKSRSEELSLARRLKTLKQELEMKLAAQDKLEKDYRMVSMLLALKEHEADLASAGVLDAIKGMSLEEIESMLLEKKLDAEDEDAFVASVISITSDIMKRDVTIEDDLEDELGEIRALRMEGKEGEEEGEEWEGEERYKGERRRKRREFEV